MLIQSWATVAEFRGDKLAREMQYFADPFVASALRAHWVGSTHDLTCGFADDIATLRPAAEEAAYRLPSIVLVEPAFVCDRRVR